MKYPALFIAVITAWSIAGCAGHDPARTFASPTPAATSGFCGTYPNRQNAPVAVGVRCTLADSDLVYLSMAQAQAGQNTQGSYPFSVVQPGDCVIHDVANGAFSCIVVGGENQELEISGNPPGVADSGGFVFKNAILYVSSDTR